MDIWALLLKPKPYKVTGLKDSDLA